MWTVGTNRSGEGSVGKSCLEDNVNELTKWLLSGSMSRFHEIIEVSYTLRNRRPTGSSVVDPGSGTPMSDPVSRLIQLKSLTVNYRTRILYMKERMFDSPV